jgi:glucose/mannose-6-phosphate isomerase
MDNPGIDKNGMINVINGYPQQIKESYGMDIKISLNVKPTNIFICGMGGSSIAGQLIETFLKAEDIGIPVYAVEDYSLPRYTDKNSLVIISSYSGNTEETISCYREALRRSLNMIIITSGGKLSEHAAANRIPIINIPKGLQPRNAIAYLFFPIIRILENAGIIGPQDGNVKSLISSLQKNGRSYQESAEGISEKLHGRLPIIYSSEKLYSVAYRWKCEFNENSKIPSFCHRFPELDHNEIVGYVNHAKLSIPMHVIILRDDHDHRRVLKRMDITKKLIKEATKDGVTFTDIHITGDNILSRIFMTIYLGDLVSYYLALRYGTDPTPVELVEKLKKDMGPFI